MFNRKKNEAPAEETSNVNLEDIFYLLSLVAEKAGVNLEADEAEKDIEENEVVDVEKFFEEEKQEGNHDESIKEDKNKELIENEDVDKRKVIDEIGGILKDKVSEETWRTIIGLVEKDAYNPSSDGDEKVNGCKKNEAEDKEIIKKQRKDSLDNIEEDTEKKPILNTIKNSLNNFSAPVLLSRRERIAEANKKYSL